MVNLVTIFGLIDNVLVFWITDDRLYFTRVCYDGEIRRCEDLVEEGTLSGVALSGWDQVIVAIEDVGACEGIFSIHLFGKL